MRHHRLLPCVILLSLLATAPRAQDAPTPTDAAIEAFLSKARVVSTRAIGKGVTRALRATLSDGTLTHDAQIQIIDDFKPVYRTRKGEERNFRDSWRFNVAAYRIDRLVGLGMVPVSVKRRFGMGDAAFTWWVDDVILDEEGRRKSGAVAPDVGEWESQMRVLRFFDQLIDNTDRNQGNIIITKTWKVWAIDHTRAFRYSQTPRQPEHVTPMKPELVNRLKLLDFATLKREVGGYLTDADIRNLLARRDAMLKLQ